MPGFRFWIVLKQLKLHLNSSSLGVCLLTIYIYIEKGVIGLDLPLRSPSNMVLTLTQEATLCLQWYLPSFVSALVTCMALVMSKFVSIEFNAM
jgi:hypothetical protein